MSLYSTPSIQELVQIAKSHNAKKDAWDRERELLLQEFSALNGKKAAWDLCRRDIEEQIYNYQSVLNLNGHSGGGSNSSLDGYSSALNPHLVENQDTSNIIENTIDDYVKPPHKTDFAYKLKHTLPLHLDCIRAIAFFDSNPTIVSSSDDGTMRIMNLEPKSQTKRKVRRPPQNISSMRGHSLPIISLASFSSGGNQMIISGSLDGSIGVWQMPKADISLYDIHGIITHSRTYLYTFHTDAVWSIDIMGMNAISASADKTLKVWDILLGDPKDIKVSSPPLLCKVCDDNNFVVACANNALMYYQDLIFHSQINLNVQITALTVAKNDHLAIVGCANGQIKILQYPNMALIKEINAHAKQVSGLCLTPCNDFFISCGHDGLIKGWSLESFEMCQALGKDEKEAHLTKYGEGAICCAGGNSSKLYFATGGTEGALHVFLHD